MWLMCHCVYIMYCQLYVVDVSLACILCIACGVFDVSLACILCIVSGMWLMCHCVYIMYCQWYVFDVSLCVYYVLSVVCG